MKFYTFGQLSEMLQVSLKTIQRATTSTNPGSKLVATKIEGSWRVSSPDLRLYLKKRSTGKTLAFEALNETPESIEKIEQLMTQINQKLNEITVVIKDLEIAFQKEKVYSEN